MEALNLKNICLTPWCNEKSCEKEANEKSKQESLQISEQADGEDILTGAAKTLCIPFEQTPLKENAKCFACGAPAKVKALWGRSY
jgi:prolyl-tRNA synthetase